LKISALSRSGANVTSPSTFAPGATSSVIAGRAVLASSEATPTSLSEDGKESSKESDGKGNREELH